MTTFTGDDLFSDISPDGSKIIYQANNGITTTLWVMNIDGTNKTQLPITGNPGLGNWSPDGNKIAYNSEAENWWEVWVADTDGSNAQRLTTHGPAAGHPAWSPDGQKLVYLVNPGGFNHDVYVVNSDGTGQSLLVSSSVSGFSNHRAAWSPDGTQIATVHWANANSSGPYDLWLMDADGTNGSVLVADIDHPHRNTISWTPDGNWLFFGKAGNVWRVRRDGTQLTQIANNGGWEPSIGAPPPIDFCTPSSNESDIILLLDRSGSMGDDNKLVDAKAAVSVFLGEISAPPDQVGLVSFAKDATLDQQLTTDTAAVDAAAQAISAKNSTYIDLGLQEARSELGSARHVVTHTKVIVLLSDGGQSNDDTVAVLVEAAAAKAEGAVIFAIGLGANVDAALLQQIATSLDHYYFAPTGADLEAIYQQINAQLACPSIGGQVFIDTDEDGQYTQGVDTPLSGVTVDLDGEVQKQTVSDSAADGNYLFDLNPAGHYTLTVDLSSLPANYTATTPISYVLDLTTDDVDNDFGFRSTLGKDIVYTRPKPQDGWVFDTNIWIMDFDGSNQTQLTTSPELDRWSVISPDGSRIAWVSHQNNQGQLWVMNIDGSNKVQLPLGSHSSRPDWSPDGTKLAFQNNLEDWWEIWVINADGSNLQRLTTHGPAAETPSWSPDGQKLVYLVETSAWRDDLWTVNVDGTGSTLLVSATATGFSNHDPAWSPDGTQIATIHFPAGNQNGRHDLWLMDADGSNGYAIVTDIEFIHANSIGWSADGTRLYFTKDDNVWRVQRDGTDLTQITTNGGWEPAVRRSGPITTTLASVEITGPTVGLVGSSYAFMVTVSPGTATLPITYDWEATGQTDVAHVGGVTDVISYTWSMTGPQTITVTATNASGSVMDTHVTTIIPVEQTPGPGEISYTRPQPDTASETNIWIMDFDGSNQTQLTTQAGHDRFSDISPNGTKIIYQAYNVDLSAITLWVMDIDGSNKTQLPILLDDHPNGAVWSPDGSRIAFGSDAQNWWEIWVADADGSNMQRLTTHGPAAGHASWSPDGQKLVYAVNSSTNYLDLYTVNADGTGQSLLASTASGYSYHMPSWSPDGSQIASVRWPAGTDSNFDLWLMDVDGLNGTVLVTDIDQKHHNNIAWSQDGTWLFFAKGGNVWRVRRDGAYLTQITTNGGWEPSIAASAVAPAPNSLLYLPIVMRNP